MLENKIAIHLARVRYATCIVVYGSFNKRSDMREWLVAADLKGSFRFYVPLLDGPNINTAGRTEVYFSDPDAAFAFKMRWV